MNRLSKLTVAAAALTVAVSSFGTSAFADWRLRDETLRDDRPAYENRDRASRDNERVTVEGRISNMTRERDGYRDGYRVTLERNGSSFWVPERYVRGTRDFRIGLFVRLGGVFRHGAVFVDAVDYPAPPRADREWWADRVYVRGRVDRIDLRRHVVLVRDEFSHRTVTIDVEQLDRRSRRFDLDDVRRGDWLEVWGDWRGGGVLQAARVEWEDRR